MKKNIIYKDLDLNFLRHPITNDVNTITNIEDIKRSISNLLKLKRNEYPFHPEISSGIYDSFFENMNILQIDKLKDSIKNLLVIYEPRILVNEVNINSNLDGNDITIFLYFTIKNIQTPVTYTVKLSRNR